MRYPTVEDLSLLPNRGEKIIPLEISSGKDAQGKSYFLGQVTYADNEPVYVRIRALTARQQAEVDRTMRSVAAKYGAELDVMTAAVETVFHGLVEPRLEEEHKSILWNWNGEIVIALADQIRDLGYQNARPSLAAIKSQLEQMAGVSIPPSPESKSSTSRKRQRRHMGDADSERAPTPSQPD